MGYFREGLAYLKGRYSVKKIQSSTTSKLFQESLMRDKSVSIHKSNLHIYKFRMSTGFGNCVARRISVYYTPQTPKLCELMSANSKEEKFCLKSSTVNLRIQSEYRKIRTRENSVFGHFSRSGGKQERVQTDFNRNT